MIRRFDGMNALVTGASRGIGAAVAERLAAEGANVAVVARAAAQSADAPGTLAETAARVASYGARAAAIEADLAVPTDRKSIVMSAIEQLGGPIDILVNNAALNMPHTLLDYSLERRHRMFELNFNAAVDLTQAVLPGMIERGAGWVVNVSSGSARLAPGPPFNVAKLGRLQGVYGASKAALNRITNAFAVEFADYGIRCNTVEPRAAVLSEGAAARGMSMIPKELIEPMETMVEGTVALCICPAEVTGRVCVSLDLIDQWGLTVYTRNAREVYRP